LFRFSYETPPNPITPYSFVSTPLVQAKYLHLVSSPLEALSTSAAFESIASSAATAYEGKGWKPRIVWEPHPMYCKPEYLEDLIKALAVVDVLSPNHDEAAGSSLVSLSLLSSFATRIRQPVFYIQILMQLLSLLLGSLGSSVRNSSPLPPRSLNPLGIHLSHPNLPRLPNPLPNNLRCPSLRIFRSLRRHSL